MAPTFDPKKNAINKRKHRVSLAAGDGVRRDPLAITVEDLDAVGEARFVTLGTNAAGALMVVVWTERDGDVRIISVRNATPKEKRDYAQGI